MSNDGGWYQSYCYDVDTLIDFIDDDDITPADTAAFVSELTTNYGSTTNLVADLDNSGEVDFADIRMYIALYNSATS